MLNRYCRYVSFLACIVLLCSVGVRAQLTTADIVGAVTDNSGAVLANAKVSLTNQATRETRSAQSNSVGQYAFTFLLPGTYSVRVESPGFKAFTSVVTVSAGDRARVDASLQVGQTSESVEVNAQTPLLQADNATVSTTLTVQPVQDLPLPTRNLTTLVQFAPGANEASEINGLSSGQRPDDRRQTSSFTVNGQDEQFNNIQIDGTDNNERIIGTIGVKPPIDSIQEVNVETNNYTPESGRTPGGLISVITKSGSNSFHGSLYEFVQNDVFNARSPFNPVSTDPTKPDPQAKLRQNDFGGSIGGPIIKNRTFFFFGYEGFRQVAGVQNPIISTVPTAAQHALGPAGIVASDPSTAGLPVDPIAANLFKLYPLPNFGPPGATTGNFLFDPNKTQYSNTYDARVDHRFNNNNLFYGRFTSNNVSALIPTNLPNVTINGVSINPGNGQYGFAGPAKDIAYNGQLNFTHIFSPALLLELKAAYTRINNLSNSPNSGTKAATVVGFPSNINYGPLSSSGLPLIGISGFAPLGDSNFVPIVDTSNTFQYDGAITYNRGTHNIKAGASLIRRQAQNVQSNEAVGHINFGLPEDGGGPTNNNLATFLVGAFNGEGRNNDLFTPNYRSWEIGFYAQDNWRMKSWLTITYGLRYDIYTPFTERHGYLSNYDPANHQLLIPASGLATIKALGIDTTGMVASSDTAGLKTNYGDFAPRIGFAATVMPGTVIRGGFGMAYFPGNYTSNASLKNAPFNGIYAPGCQSPLATAIELHDGQTPPSPTCGTGAVATASTTLAQGIPIPVPQSLVSANLGLPDNVALNFRTSYVYQFNLLAEKQFGANVVTVGYVGASGRHLPVVLNDVNVQDPRNPASHRGPDGRLDTRPTVTLLPNLGSVGMYESAGSSSYNALQTSFQRRFSHGLSASANYTWSHEIDDATHLSMEGQEGFGNADPFDIRHVERGNGDLDLRHRFVATASYELPFGRNFSGVRKTLLGGWQTNMVWVWNSGSPFSLTDNYSGFGNSVYAGVGGGPTRPDQIASASVSDPSTNHNCGCGAEWFNRQAFVIPTLGTIGNFRRNSLYGPQFRHVDFSVFKDFEMTERYKVQFRAEFFNITNTPNYFVPNDQNVSATTNLVPTLAQHNAGQTGIAFAQIDRMNPNYTPRQVQFALKFLF